MIIVYIFIIGAPLLLIFFIIKKMMRARRIKQHGITGNATITYVRKLRIYKGSMDMLTLEYEDATGRCYPAKATVPVGKYRTGEQMPISYISGDATQYTFDNGKGYWVLLIFCMLLLLFTIFASYKINEMVQAGNYHFTG